MKILIILLLCGVALCVSPTAVQCALADGTAVACATSDSCRKTDDDCIDSLKAQIVSCATSATECLCVDLAAATNCVIALKGLCSDYSATNLKRWKSGTEGECTVIAAGKCKATDGFTEATPAATECVDNAAAPFGACKTMTAAICRDATTLVCTTIATTATTKIHKLDTNACSSTLTAGKCIDTTTFKEGAPTATQCASATNGQCTTMTATGSVGVKSATDKTCTATAATTCFAVADYIVKAPTKGDGTCIDTGVGPCYAITNTSAKAQDSVSFKCLTAKDGTEGTPPLGCKDWDATAKNCTDCGTGKTYGATTFKCETTTTSSSLSLRFDMIAGLLMGALALNFF